MAFFTLTTKQGTPIKSLSPFLIKPKVAPAPVESAINKYLPVSTIKYKPEAPTTTNIKQMLADIPARHEVVYPPVVDRGGNRMSPFLGMSKLLPNDAIGGKPNRIQPVLQTLAAQTKNIGPLNGLKASKLQAVIRKTAIVQSQRKKKHVVEIVPGPSALDFARSPRRFVDAVTGQLKMRSAIPILRKKSFGIFSQHRTAPASTVNRLAFISAQKRESLIEPQLRMLDKSSKSDSEVKRPFTVEKLDEMTTIAAPIATENAEQSNRETLERFAFLAAVGVIGYFALRR